MNNYSQKNITRILAVFGGIIVSAGILLAFKAEAATIFISPSSSRVNNNGLVTLKIYINSQSKTINNAEAVLNYPEENLEIMSVNSRNSIFSLWVEPPTFSNSNGRLSFNGGVPNPGFNGNSGEVVTIVFRAKRAGSASLSLYDAAIRENDGEGTDILTGQGSANIEIIASAKESAESKPVSTPASESSSNNTVNGKQNAGSKPNPTSTDSSPSSSLVTPKSNDVAKVSLLATPNQSGWSNKNKVNLAWNVSGEIKAVKTILDQDPHAQPKILYTANTKKDISGLDDGVWYLNSSYQTAAGWSPVSSERINIDTHGPESINVQEEYSPDGQPRLKLAAKDTISGVDYYSISVDKAEPIKVMAKEAVPADFALSGLSFGQHEVITRAYDKAGNMTENKKTILLEPKSAPIISSESESVKIGDSFKLSGKSDYKFTSITIIISDQSGNESENTIITDQKGDFAFSSLKYTTPGEYEAWAFVKNPAGKNGPISNKLHFSVTLKEKPLSSLPEVFGKYWKASYILNIVLSILLIITIIYIFVLKQRSGKFKRRSRWAKRLGLK